MKKKKKNNPKQFRIHPETSPINCFLWANIFNKFCLLALMLNSEAAQKLPNKVVVSVPGGGEEELQTSCVPVSFTGIDYPRPTHSGRPRLITSH